MVVIALVRVDENVAEDERTRKAVLGRQYLGCRSKYVVIDTLYGRTYMMMGRTDNYCAK